MSSAAKESKKDETEKELAVGFLQLMPLLDAAPGDTEHAVHAFNTAESPAAGADPPSAGNTYIFLRLPACTH
jgi:hypothetical protein